MPSKQPRRRGHAAAGVPDIRSDQRDPVTVDRLAFKYMEMCKVDSTSDSESDTSPRWSDASSKSFQGGTGLKRPTLPQKPFGRHYQQTLDPYDGSSEDSASSADGAKRQKRGGFRVKGRSCSRMAANPLPSHEVRRPGLRDSVPVIQFGDIHMRSSSDSELKVISHRDFQYSPRNYTSTRMADNHPPLHSANPFCTGTSFQLTDRLLSSPTHTGALSKRKMFCPFDDGGEYMHRKKQCTTQMETESIFS
ncbi:uncharacterized protein LOC103042329 [Astyanax mexicanus]|uniref:uncharacterized protein LOC103042329 n=1 Tax=Astyanax mexicanus TaxID=7994 RepID=UPI0020CB097C|nr:uncharacterized protein LOC103042329 [Astyanax mexicanus]